MPSSLLLLVLRHRRCLATTTTTAYDVAFFGSDHVALTTLQRLHANAALPADDARRCVNRLAVVCPAATSLGAHALLHHQQRNAAAARPDASELPVKTFARTHALPFLEKPSLQPLWPWPVRTIHTQTAY
jgi:hypothetical protein